MIDPAPNDRFAERLLPLFLFALVLGGLVASSLYSYVLFHSLVEIFCIFVMFSVFLLCWNSRRVLDNHYLFFLALSFVATGSLEMLHAFAYKGFGVFPGYNGNLPTQLWVAVRSVSSLSFLAAPLFVRRKVKPLPTLGGYAAVALLLIWAIFSGRFPDCFVEGRGLTPFKIYSEYLNMGLLAAAAVALHFRRESFDPRVVRLLLFAVGCNLAAGGAFTRYVSVYGPANLVGHLFLFVSASLIYQAVVVTGIRDPAAILFRTLELSKEALQESERRFRQVVESLPQLVWTCLPQGYCDYISPQWVAYTGMNEATQLGYGWLDRLHEEDRQRVLDSWNESAAQGTRFGCEFRIRRQDGVYRWFHTVAVPLRNEAGVTVKWFGTNTDIEDLKRAEESLRDSEERVRRKLKSVLSPEAELGPLELGDFIDPPALQKLLDHFYAAAGIPVSILDLKGRLLAGAGWQEICTRFHRLHGESCRLCLESDLELSRGIAPGEFRLYRCKNNLWDIATPILVAGEQVGNVFSGQFFFEGEEVDRELFREQARRFGFDEEAYLAALDRVPRLSRAKVDRGMAFLLQLSDMLAESGYSNVKLARLLAERDRLTESLTESRQMLAEAERLSHTGAWEWDIRLDRWSFSEEWLEIHGCGAASVDSAKLLALAHPDDRDTISTAMEKLRAGLSPYDLEHRVLRQDTGATRLVHARGQFVRDRDGTVARVYGFTQDITERKLADEALQTAHNELARQIEERTRQLREKEVLLKEVHHRVKNNLQVISSLVSLQSDASGDETVRGVLEDVTGRVRSMALVHEKLYLSEDLACVDFAEYAQSLLHYLWRAHGETAAGISLSLDLKPVLLSVDSAVPCGLILNELAVNALKHAFRGRDRGEVAVFLAGAEDGAVSFTVRDDGVGIPADLDWRSCGSLGLRLVQMLSGQLRATVDLDRSGGTGFTVTFRPREAARNGETRV